MKIVFLIVKTGLLKYTISLKIFNGFHCLWIKLPTPYHKYSTPATLSYLLVFLIHSDYRQALPSTNLPWGFCSGKARPEKHSCPLHKADVTHSLRPTQSYPFLFDGSRSIPQASWLPWASKYYGTWVWFTILYIFKLLNSPVIQREIHNSEGSL